MSAELCSQFRPLKAGFGIFSVIELLALFELKSTCNQGLLVFAVFVPDWNLPFV
jgi:hypothetical protein